MISVNSYNVIKNLLIETTTRCNLGCPGCYMRDRAKENLEFTIELFSEIVDATQPQTVSFFGGEPLLWPYLREGILICRQRNIKISIASNLTLLAKESAHFLYNNEVMVFGKLNIGDITDTKQLDIQSKLIGSSREKVNKMISGILLLKNIGFAAPGFNLNNFIRKDNIEFVGSFLEFCTENNIEPFMEISCNENDLSEKEIDSIVNQVQKYHKGPLMPPHFISRCRHFDSTLYFRPNGDIQACSGNKTILANFLTDQDAITNALNNSIIKTRKNIVEHINGECKQCDLLDQCKGGCRAYAEQISVNESYLKCWRNRQVNSFQ